MEMTESNTNKLKEIEINQFVRIMFELCSIYYLILKINY